MTTAHGQARAADTRRVLLDTARRLFVERGYAATGTEEIVARSGVTRGALYHHFRDKADLFSAVMQAVADELAQRLVADQLARPSHPDAWAQLRDGVQGYLDVACVDTDFQQIVLVQGPAVLGTDAWNALVDKYGLALLREWLRKAIDDGHLDALPIPPLARLLAALIAEASLYLAQDADPAGARAQVGPVLDRILAGLEPIK